MRPTRGMLRGLHFEPLRRDPLRLAVAPVPLVVGLAWPGERMVPAAELFLRCARAAAARE